MEIETWKGDDFKYILNDWNNMEFALTKMDYPELSMAGSVLLQFIQPGYNRPCCGHWALDTVRVTSLEIKGEPIFTEAFDGANTAMWNYPSKSKAYTYGFDDGLYFSGDPNTKTTIRTKFTMPQSTIIKATIDKNDACNNHYIAISKSKDLKFFWEHQKMLFISCGTATKSTFMHLITELRSIARKIPKLNYRSVWKKVG